MTMTYLTASAATASLAPDEPGSRGVREDAPCDKDNIGVGERKLTSIN